MPPARSFGGPQDSAGKCSAGGQCAGGASLVFQSLTSATPYVPHPWLFRAKGGIARLPRRISHAQTSKKRGAPVRSFLGTGEGTKPSPPRRRHLLHAVPAPHGAALCMKQVNHALEDAVSDLDSFECACNKAHFEVDSRRRRAKAQNRSGV